MQIGSTSQRQRCKRMSGGFVEREPLPHRLYLSRRPAPLDINAIRLAIRNTVSDMGSMLRSSPEDARRAFGALFGQNRLPVQPDPERGFVVRGETLLCCGGAGDRTRTCTPSRTVAPKATASTRSATPAIRRAT